MLRAALRLPCVLLVAACGQGSAVPDAAPGDASTDAPADATIGPPTDAAIDSVDPCAGGPTINVHIQAAEGFNDLEPHPGVKVVFVAPDGSTALSTVTDADGRAAAPGVDGMTVFLSGVNDTEAGLHVFTRVPACATIELRPPPWEYYTGGTVQGQTTFLFQTPAALQNAVYGPCGVAHGAQGTLVSQTILHVSGCDEYEHDATLALARGNTGITGWTTLTHVDLTAIVGQVVTVPPLQPPVPATVHWSNGTAGWGFGDTIFFAGPGLHWRGATQEAGGGPIHTASFDNVWGVAPLGPATLISTTFELAPVPPSEHRQVERVRPTTDLVGSIDVAGAMGTITRASVSATPGPGFAASWTWASNANHRGDLVMASLHDTSQGKELRVYGPGDVDHLEVPRWPAELSDWVPDPNQLYVDLVTAFDLDGDATYADCLTRGQLGRDYHQLQAGPEFPGRQLLAIGLVAAGPMTRAARS